MEGTWYVVITVLSNTGLLIYVFYRGTFNLRIKTTSFVTTVFILTYVPYGSVILASSTSGVQPSRVVRHLAARCLSIACWSNPLIYLFLDVKLRRFVRELIVATSRGRRVDKSYLTRQSQAVQPLTRFRGAATTVSVALALKKQQTEKVTHWGEG